MKASGNGEVEQCIQNLLLTIRGEVPYERTKGLDPRIIDKPKGTAENEIMQDADWLIEVFEPRVSVSNVKISGTIEAGHFFAKVSIEKQG